MSIYDPPPRYLSRSVSHVPPLREPDDGPPVPHPWYRPDRRRLRFSRCGGGWPMHHAGPIAVVTWGGFVAAVTCGRWVSFRAGDNE